MIFLHAHTVDVGHGDSFLLILIAVILYDADMLVYLSFRINNRDPNDDILCFCF